MNMYTHSTIIKKLMHRKSLSKPLKIAFVDIDATFTGHSTVTRKARVKLEELGYALVFVTARTEEMVMSQDEYQKSLQLGCIRPKPFLKKQQNIYTYVDPKVHNTNLVDPDIIIGSTGTQILVKQISGGYAPDVSFEKQFVFSPRIWREKVLKFIHMIDPEETFVHLAPIESEKNYREQKTNVFPPAYRVMLFFKNLAGKIYFLQEIEKRKHTDTFLSLLNFIDDSHPEKEEFITYITPHKTSKRFAVEHVVDHIIKQTHIQKSELHVLLAGDSFPDLTMLLYGAIGTKATAIAVGGSRLTQVLTHESNHMYAGENMFLHKKKLKIQKGKTGHYNFTTIIEKETIHIRNIIFGDQAFPKTKGPETILAY